MRVLGITRCVLVGDSKLLKTSDVEELTTDFVDKPNTSR